jgi:hypothetical protein
MDDDKDKGIVEKTIEAVEGFASEVSDAAKHMMPPPEPLKPGNQVVMMPMAAAGFMGDSTMPPFVIISRPRKSRAKKAAKTTTKKTAKKSARKSAKKKKAAKSWKSASKYKAIGRKKPGKKAVKKKKAKKARR